MPKYPTNTCKGCGFQYNFRDSSTEIAGYCTQGCVRSHARRLGWKEKSGITIYQFMKDRFLREIVHA